MGIGVWVFLRFFFFSFYNFDRKGKKELWLTPPAKFSNSIAWNFLNQPPFPLERAHTRWRLSQSGLPTFCPTHTVTRRWCRRQGFAHHSGRLHTCFSGLKTPYSFNRHHSEHTKPVSYESQADTRCALYAQAYLVLKLSNLRLLIQFSTDHIPSR